MFIDVNGKTLYEGDEVILAPLDPIERLVLPSHIGTITYKENRAWVGEIEVYLYDKLTLNKRNGSAA